MPLNFPTSPVLNQTYTFNGKTWKWDGAGWISYNIGLVGPSGSIGPTGPTGPVGDYVISVNGSTGTITNVARTNEGNTFSVRQVMNAGITSANLFVSGGATFNGAIGLQNTELIRNNTFGMIDLMPGTTSTSRFGLRVDTTSWAFGTRLDAIRGDGSISPSSYGLWFNNPLYLNADADFAFNTNGAARIRYSTTGNDTLQYVVTCANANSSGAIALINPQALGSATRSPGITHTHPNFYFYANNQVRDNANDFLRFEHNIAHGLMQSGGTSGILIVPGSGFLGVSGGINVSGGSTFLGAVYATGGYRFGPSTINALTGTTYTLLTTDDGKILTMSNASGITLTIPSGLPVGFNCSIIQIGAGQVGITTASGVTLNSFNNQFRIQGQHGRVNLVEYVANIVNISGNLTI
jgi:hypothetical protein